MILLTLFPGYLTAPLGYPVSLLIGQYCSCAILQWLVTPALVKILGPWLMANAPDQRTFSIGGGLGLCAVLWALAGLFHWLNIHP